MNIRKGYCRGCPYDYGKPATETAYNLGCLPTPAEIADECGATRAWACHSEPNKVCCGFGTANPDLAGLPLLHIDGWNAP